MASTFFKLRPVNPFITWLVAAWASGWLLLPLSRQLFPRLTDGGLAAGRVLWLLGVGILSLWLGVFHILPLSLAPLWVFGIPLLGLIPLTKPNGRTDFKLWLRQHSAALKWSDGVFLVAFLFFAWMRARSPVLNDLEKPMDAALISASARANALPFPNPWFAQGFFTDYYYNYHLIGGMLLRSFHLPVAVGYNLVHPLVCALFLSTLWSLCAALAGTLLRGLACMAIVGVMGHFEPLREWAGASTVASPDRVNWLFRLDWWSTSRVITSGNTINEYPAFTLGIGDAHAHFWAFPFAVLLFALCHELLFAPLGGQPTLLSHRRVLLLLCGALLALSWTGNTWDVPIYGLLVLGCAIWPLMRVLSVAHSVPQITQPVVAPPTSPKPGEESIANRREQRRRERATLSATTAQGDMPPVVAAPTTSPAAAPDSPALIGTRAEFSKNLEWVWAVLPLFAAYVLSFPYRRTFTSQVSGLRFAPWLPPPTDVLLFWGGFIALLALCWVFQDALRRWVQSSSTGKFLWMLFCCGALAWFFPWFMYIRGVWGDGDFSHQDTVFKFGLQAWLTLGIALSCATARLFDFIPARSRLTLASAWALLWVVPFTCAANVFWTRSSRDVPRDDKGRVALSLEGDKNLSQDDQDAIAWLRTNAPSKAVVVEAANPDVSKTGDFEGDLARVSALSGVPAVLGWAQHTNSWGADSARTTALHRDIVSIYGGKDPTTGKPLARAEILRLLRDMGATYVFVGDTERARFAPDALQHLSQMLPQKVFTSGTTFIAQVP